MDQTALHRLKLKLEETLRWPAVYTFKFIAPTMRLEALRALFGGHPITVRESSGGKYVSVSGEWICQSADEIIAVYKRAQDIKGVISL